MIVMTIMRLLLLLLPDEFSKMFGHGKSICFWKWKCYLYWASYPRPRSFIFAIWAFTLAILEHAFPCKKVVLFHDKKY